MQTVERINDTCNYLAGTRELRRLAAKRDEAEASMTVCLIDLDLSAWLSPARDGRLRLPVATGDARDIAWTREGAYLPPFGDQEA